MFPAIAETPDQFWRQGLAVQGYAGFWDAREGGVGPTKAVVLLSACSSLSISSTAGPQRAAMPFPGPPLTSELEQ